MAIRSGRVTMEILAPVDTKPYTRETKEDPHGSDQGPLFGSIPKSRRGFVVMLKIIPLGGLGEIGLNMMAFEYRGSILIVDAGLMFPEAYMLGVDFVIPDMTYVRENKDKVAGIVLTHAHEDHIGALPFFAQGTSRPLFSPPPSPWAWCNTSWKIMK